MSRIGWAGTLARSAAVALAVVAGVVVLPSSALAAGPGWSIELQAKEHVTYFKTGGVGVYEMTVTNVGTAPAEEITVSDHLPAGLTFNSVTFKYSGFPTFELSGLFCPTSAGQQVTCVTKFIKVQPGQTLKLVIDAAVSPTAPDGPIVDEASVEGGGASASTTSQNAIAAHSQLGLATLTVAPTERTEETYLGTAGGNTEYQFANKPYVTPFTQAGGHPWGLTVTGEFTSEIDPKGSVVPTHDVKDIVTDLPPGLLGDPMAVPRCPLADVSRGGKLCPADTQVGVYRLRDLGEKEYLAPIINVTPEAGQSAEFALENTTAFYVPILTAHLVRTPEGKYSFTVVSKEIPQVALLKYELTFWGVPADPSHDAARGRVCRIQSILLNRVEGDFTCEGGNESAGISPVPFLTMPTDCAGGPETMTVRADSWQEPGKVEDGGGYSGYTENIVPFPAVTGCELLAFKPGTGIGLEPETKLADEPVGLGVSLKIPLSEQPGTDSAPLLRDTRVTLPEGMSVSPGVVDGIRACNAEGPEGINITGPESEFKGPDGEWHLAPGHCPDASTVGTAEAITPFLPVPVKGHVYLARPGCGGAGQAACSDQDALDGNLYKLYLELGGNGELASTGIEFKVPFQAEVNPATGQITTNVRELVQAPYSEVRIHLNGGPRAPLANPPQCGAATTTADLTPWSAPGRTPEGLFAAGTPDSLSSSVFNVEGCSNPLPFNPGFVAGTVTPQAGQFSAFTMNVSRADREQYVKGIQIHTPPGLLAKLSSVPLCPEDQANDPSVFGECSASKIGTVRVASGAGSHPFEIEGNVYLTGPYGGAPFGLSVVTHAVAGPFNLGLVVVRTRINIDPADSTATITTDETGPYALPQIIFGVPLRLQRITVNIDRPGFMLNPTSCGAMSITATISGNQNATASVSSPFAVGGCKSLAFKPSFSVSTSGHTSRAQGASLDTKLAYPSGAMGKDANIAYVKVSLPKQLPSYLPTLQKACLAATFDANPAQCPAGSIVGIAKTTTPLLSGVLSGPVYFVSHGGEAFPSLIVVLQGDGVRVDLVGETFINKAGITSTTFKTIPDVPVDTFELYLPQGKNHALAANTNLCTAASAKTIIRKRKITMRMHGKTVHRTVTKRVNSSGLVMPTEFVAQNGMVFKQSTPITVNGCGSTAKGARAHRARTAKTHRRGGHGK